MNQQGMPMMGYPSDYKVFLYSSLALALRTNNIIYDAIAMCVLITFLDMLFGSVNQIKPRIKIIADKIQRDVEDYVNEFMTSRIKAAYDERVFTLYFITPNTVKEVNEDFEVFEWFLMKSSDFSKQPEVIIQRLNGKTTFSVPRSKTVEFSYKKFNAKYLIYEKEIEMLDGNNARKRNNMVINITVSIPVGYTDNFLEEFIKTARQEYAEYKATLNWSPKYYENRDDKWSEQPLTSERSIDTVILRNNEQIGLKGIITDFVKDKAWYKKVEAVYSMSFLCYGLPGTGKTSFIKALAKETNRNIRKLSLSTVANDKQLTALIDKCNFDRDIIVIEEIDACGINLNRKATNRDTDAVMVLKPDPRDPSKQVLVEKETITLSALLNMLDGIANTDGRIIVITTNHPEKLDEALSRSGRITTKIEFKLCDDAQIKGIYKLFYEEPMPEGYNFPDDKVSPAYITNLFTNYRKDKKKALDILTQAIKDLQEDKYLL